MAARPYSSAQRDASAAATRTAILDSALALFFRDGYPGITIGDIARDAGVAVNTVYLSVGGKPQIVLALIERTIADPTISGVLERLFRIDDGRDVLRVLVDGIRINYELVYESIVVMYDSATGEPVIAAARGDAERYYRSNLVLVAEHLAAKGQLADGIDVVRATDVMWFYLGLGAWRVLRDQGWSWVASSSWLAERVSGAIIRTDGIGS